MALGIVAARIFAPSYMTQTTVNEPRATSTRPESSNFRKRN